MTSTAIKAVLFDLDGTLVDSAPDLAAAVNRLLHQHGRAARPYAELRAVVSKGGRALLAKGFPDYSESQRDALLPVFLDDYATALAVDSRPFDGVMQLLERIENDGLHWGIVTNKPERLARGVVDGMGWQARSAVLVGGDTLPTRKPDPAPLFFACQQLGITPNQALYVGDDKRDVDAAHAAGMPCLVALWGYREIDDDPALWQGDAYFDTPADLLCAASWLNC